MTNLEPGEIVMCTVERIAGTVVFVNIDGDGTGSIVLSEVAPGRIRNLRNYVVPKKRIICKVLRVSGNHVDLSLRRVTPKEQKEIRERYKLEKSYESLLKTTLKNKADSLISKIKEKSTLFEFLENAKENPKGFEDLIGKEEAKKIIEIIKTQKKRKIEIKKEFSLTTIEPDGLKKIKEVLSKIKDLEIKYIASGKYTISIKTEDPKKGDNLIKENLEEIEKKAKKSHLNFAVKER